MGFSNEIENIKSSLANQSLLFKSQLILNPVENVPMQSILSPSTSFLHGLYNSDKIRNDTEKKNTKIQFSNRDFISIDINNIYKIWEKILHAEKVSMRMFSGLHAHMVVFMAITNIGDTVLLLPEKAGGHMATKSILERLGLNICECAIDYENMQVDVEKTKTIIYTQKPKVIFIDRSEGLKYENFSWLNEFESIYKIYDASQYLSNIIANDYINPFNMGFDAIISTLHKNIPGPQRALFCTKKEDKYWHLFNSNISTYVSNMHSHDIYSAGLLLEDFDTIKKLSDLMLKNTMRLDQILTNGGLDVVKRVCTEMEPNTHHIWIKFENKDIAYDFYGNMEQTGISVNYRLLPYCLGYGARLGLSAATFSGINLENIETLGDIVIRASQGDITDRFKKEVKDFIYTVKNNNIFNKKDLYE